MNKKIDWNKVIDVVQNVMVFIVIILTAVCILALIFADVVIGKGTMSYLTNDNDLAGWGISLATTGVLLVLMLLLYFAWKGKWGWGALLAIGIPVVVVYCVDVFFDAMLADILRYGGFVTLNTLPAGSLHPLFRVLLGSISTMGDGMGMTLLIGLPVLKDIIGHSGVVKTMEQHDEPKRSSPVGQTHPVLAHDQTGVPEGSVRIKFPDGHFEVKPRHA